MSKLRMKIAVSLDGYVAGPHQSVEHPLGVGGQRVHEWVFGLKAWRARLGMAGGEDNASTRVIDRSWENIGATIMGRNMFGGQPGPWKPEAMWNGWWGTNPPYHHPVFVLTHHPREPLVLEGGNTFTFVTDGLESALAQAREAAGGQDVALAGGAATCNAYLKAGLVDEMTISLAPVLLGAGERLFAGVGADLHGLKLVDTIPAPGVVHLVFER